MLGEVRLVWPETALEQCLIEQHCLLSSESNVRRTDREEKDADEGVGCESRGMRMGGFDDEHFGVYLLHGAYTHCPFLHKVGRRDAAVFRSNWIY